MTLREEIEAINRCPLLDERARFAAVRSAANARLIPVLRDRYQQPHRANGVILAVFAAFEVVENGVPWLALHIKGVTDNARAKLKFNNPIMFRDTHALIEGNGDEADAIVAATQAMSMCALWHQGVED